MTLPRPEATGTHAANEVEAVIRELAPRVLGVLVRRYRDFDASEDALQEALIAAATQWPAEGIPSNPTGWLITVATRRWTERWRSDEARRRREETAAALTPDAEGIAANDDTLTLLLLCCHSALSPVSQVALTLRAVGGLTTPEIARALLVPEATVAQRISRAKQRIRESGGEFSMPPDPERSERMVAVLRVLYLIFNEGYAASSGAALVRVDLTAEAIRLTRQVRSLLPNDGEVAGLLALMLLTEARRPARVGPAGALIPLADQDRGLWDRAAIAEGSDLVTRTLVSASIGPYQLQAAIAAVHDEAATYDDTDWPQILALYELLGTLAPGPMVTLNRIVAVAMVRGGRTGLEELAAAESDPALAGHHRVAAVRAHLLAMTGDLQEAAEQFRLAARRTLSLPERRYLESQAARLRVESSVVSH